MKTPELAAPITVVYGVGLGTVRIQSPLPNGRIPVELVVDTAFFDRAQLDELVELVRSLRSWYDVDLTAQQVPPLRLVR